MPCRYRLRGRPGRTVSVGHGRRRLGYRQPSIAWAVLMAFQPGQEGAEAIADLLTGNASPSGRLVVSIPKNVGAVPYYYNHKLKSSGTPIAYHFGSRYPFWLWPGLYQV